MSKCRHIFVNPITTYGELEERVSPQPVMIEGVLHEQTQVVKEFFVSGLCSLCGKYIDQMPDGFMVIEGSTTYRPLNQ
jgi:hypothetical protein